MAHAISIDILQLLEEKLGKEEGRKVAQAIEIGLEAIEKKSETVAVKKKLELKDELTKELITKAEFFGETKTLRQEIETLRQQMQTIKVELEGKIAKLDQKFNFMIIIVSVLPLISQNHI